MKKFGLNKEDNYSLVAFITGVNKPQRIMGSLTRLLERSNATEEEYGGIISMLRGKVGSRILIGPLPNVVVDDPKIMNRISNWTKELRSHNGKREELMEFFSMLIGDLEMNEVQRELLLRRMQTLHSSGNLKFFEGFAILRNKLLTDSFPCESEGQ